MVDRYTRCVLTVIAVALVVLVIQDTIRTSVAQSPNIQKVQICDERNCATLKPYTFEFGGHSNTVDVLPVLSLGPIR
jgi:hypothetical protein